MSTMVTYEGHGSAPPLPVTFPYIDKAHVKVYVDDVLLSVSDYTWPTASSIQLVDPVPVGSVITIKRETPQASLVTYQSGATLTQEDLEIDSLQARYLIEELDTHVSEVEADVAAAHFDRTVLPAGVPLGMVGYDNDGDALVTYTPDAFVAAATAGAQYQFNVAEGDTIVDASSIPGPWAPQSLFYNGVFQNASGWSKVGNDIVFSEALPADGTVAIVAVFTGPGQLNQADLVGYTAPFTGAVSRSQREKSADIVSTKDFGSTGLGIADDTPKIQAAIDAMSAAGGGIVHIPQGTHQILSPLVGKSGVTLRGVGAKSKLRLGALSYAFLTEGTLSTDLTNTLAANAAISATSITLAAGKGANFAVGDYCLLSSEAAMPQGASVNKRAEFVRVKTVVADTITVESPLVYAYNTADTARLRKVTMVTDFAIEDMTIDGNYVANSATFRRSQTVFSWCLRPRVSRVRFRDLGQQAISFGGCIGWIVDNCQFDDLASNDASDYGYAVHESAINVAGRMINCTGERVRHMYTTTDASTPFAPGYGQTMGPRIVGCTALWPRAAGFDTHEGGLDVSFSSCNVIGGGRAGFQLRSVRTSVTDCVVTDTVGEAVYVDSSAEDSFIKNVRALRTNTGTDDLAVNHIDRGAIFDNGKRTTVTDCRIELCGGPAIEAFTGATGAFYERNLVRNPCQKTTTALYGIYVNTGSVINIDIHSNRFIVTDGLCTTAIRASNGNTTGFITGNVARGITTPWNFGGAIMHQSNSPGPLLSVGQSNPTLTIASGVIDVTSLLSPSFMIAGEGGLADDLVTINGGVSGQTIYMRRATGVNITLKHGTGNIFLPGSTDKILGGSFDTIQLIKNGVNWIGSYYADV